MYQSTYGFSQPITTDLDLSAAQPLHLIVERPGDVLIDRIVDPADIDAVHDTVTWHVQEGDLSVSGIYTLYLIDETNGRRIMTDPARVYVAPAPPGA